MLAPQFEFEVPKTVQVRGIYESAGMNSTDFPPRKRNSLMREMRVLSVGREAGAGEESFLVLKDQEAALGDLLGPQVSSQLFGCTDVLGLLEALENGACGKILLKLREEHAAVLEVLGLIQSLGEPTVVHLIAAEEPRWEGWTLPPWLRLHHSENEDAAISESLLNPAGPDQDDSRPSCVGDLPSLVDAGRLSVHLRLSLGSHSELEVVSHDGEIWSALLEDSLGSEVLVETLFEPVTSVISRRHSGPAGQRWIFESLQEIFLKTDSPILDAIPQGGSAKVVSIARSPEGGGGGGEGVDFGRANIEDSDPNEKNDSMQISLKEKIKMGNITETLGEAMEIEGARGAAVADYESGMCLGFQGGGPDLDMEVAAAGNAEVVRSKEKVMAQLGLKDDIEDILITLGKEYHLIIPISGEKLFIYVALSRKSANLALARHKVRALGKGLSV